MDETKTAEDTNVKLNQNIQMNTIKLSNTVYFDKLGHPQNFIVNRCVGLSCPG